MSVHTCSRQPERCPSCGHGDTRDGFEGFEGTPPDTEFVVRCPKCEALHPDQSDWDDIDCDACQDEWIEDDRRALANLRAKRPASAPRGAST